MCELSSSGGACLGRVSAGSNGRRVARARSTLLAPLILFVVATKLQYASHAFQREAGECVFLSVFVVAEADVLTNFQI